jgi:simple sugar transport system substrate-binding protein
MDDIKPIDGNQLWEEMLETNEEGQHGFNRRSLLKRGAAVGLGGAVLLGPAGSAFASASKPSQKGGRILWTTHSIGEWNAPVDVGFRDAANQLGMKYQKTGVITDFSVAKMVNEMLKAIASKPTIWVTTWTDPRAFTAPLKKALAAGLTVVINNTNQTDQGNELKIPYVGQSFFDSGIVLGRRVATESFNRGIKRGSIPNGNPEPGHSALEARTKGIIEGVRQINKEKGTKFKVESFADKSRTDPTTSVTLWKNKIRSEGKNLGGIVTVGFSSIVAALKAIKELNMKPGQVGVGSFDTEASINQGVKDGYIQILIDQQLYSQGYIPPLLAWQAKERGFYAPLIFDTGSAIVDKSNVDFVIKRDENIIKLAKKYGLIK